MSDLPSYIADRDRTAALLNLSRVLDRKWQDRTGALYDVFHMWHWNTRQQIPQWAHAIQNENPALMAHERKFNSTMEALRAAGSPYDPRKSGHPPPRGGHIAVKARAAKEAWKKLQWARTESNFWCKMVDEAGARKRVQVERDMENLTRAKEGHSRFMHTARKVGRKVQWRAMQTVVVCGLRWMRCMRGH